MSSAELMGNGFIAEVERDKISSQAMSSLFQLAACSEMPWHSVPESVRIGDDVFAEQVLASLDPEAILAFHYTRTNKY